MRRIVAIASLISLVALCAAVVATAATPPESQAMTVAADDAVKAVEAFVPDVADMKVSSLLDASDHRYYSVDGSGVHANVDAFDGHVRTLTLLDAVPTDSEVTVSRDDVAATAAKYLASHGITTDGMTMLVRLLDHGSSQEYQVSWELRVNGALAPDSRSVSVNPANGAVFGLTNFGRGYVNPPIARVSADEAAAAANELLGVSTSRVVSMELRVDFDSAGSQTLVWWIQLADLGSDGSAAFVQVDAVTGSAQVLGRG